MSAELHAGLFGGPIGFPRIAGDARQDAVLPGGLTALSPRDHVVDRQFFGAGLAAAILAGGVVPFEQVAPAERHGLVPRLIVAGQGQDFRHPEMEPHGPDEGLAFLGPELGPIRPVVKLEIVRVDHAGGLVPQHDQGPRHRRHVHRLPVPVQDQSRSFQDTATHEWQPSARAEKTRSSLPGPRATRA